MPKFRFLGVTEDKKRQVWVKDLESDFTRLVFWVVRLGPWLEVQLQAISD